MVSLLFFVLVALGGNGTPTLPEAIGLGFFPVGVAVGSGVVDGGTVYPGRTTESARGVGSASNSGRFARSDAVSAAARASRSAMPRIRQFVSATVEGVSSVVLSRRTPSMYQRASWPVVEWCQ